MVNATCHPDRVHEAHGLCLNCYKRSTYDPARASVRNRQARVKARGLRLDEFEQMKNSQNGMCKICGRMPPHTLNIDHDHVTGEVRGLLCVVCNTSLGWYEKNALSISSYLHG
jgi:formate dehydrogenase maturation protein FdhE